jgi:hypothetical protein
MPLPDPFNEVEHLQLVTRQTQNQRVREYFSDLSWSDDGVPDLEIVTPRGSLLVACYHKDNDPLLVTLLRNQLFFSVLGYQSGDVTYYLGAINDNEYPVTGHPKICFYFSQDESSVPEGGTRADMEISFRYMKYNQATFTLSVARELATEIKQQFISAGKGIIHTKGNLRYMCHDPENGLTRKNGLLSNDEKEALEIYQKLYAVMDKTFDQTKITVNNPKKESSNNTGTHTVFGETVKKPAYRPVVNVRFRYACAVIPGKKTPVYLCSTYYGKFTALFYA